MGKEKQAFILYKHLSEELARRGMSSNYFSELEELYHLADLVDTFRDSVAKHLTDKIMLAGENDKLKANNEKLQKKLDTYYTTAATSVIKDLEKEIERKDDLLKELIEDPIEENPDEGQRCFFCGCRANINFGEEKHSKDCPVVKAKQALSEEE